MEFVERIKMKQRTIKIINGQFITPNRIIRGGTLVIKDGKITAFGQENIEIADALVIDAKEQYVSPGFIDLHLHGGGGHDFMDGTLEAFLEIAKTHARYGTTSMVPTTLTAEKEELLHTLKLYEEAKEKNTAGSAFLGMHIEGPYFALNQRGAQDPRYIRDPNPEEYIDILNASKHIVRWSAAPERKGGMEFGRYLRSKNVIASIAHTDAIYEDVLEAVDNGYTLATHLYSAMLGVTRRNAFRYAGAVEAALVVDEMDVELITDGVHLPAGLLKLVYKVKGPDRTALITDAMRGAAMPEGDSILGSLHDGLKVIIEDGVAKLPDRTAFAGSVATADRLIRTITELADVPLADAIKMASSTPARIMGVLDRKGTIMVGKDADLIIFDKNISVNTTIVEGRIVHLTEKVECIDEVPAGV